MAEEPIGRPDRPADQFTAAIGAVSLEYFFGAVVTERALEGADARVRRIGRQVLVAAFAIGSQFQHRRGPETVAMGERLPL
jgi:hypothetical protein